MLQIIAQASSSGTDPVSTFYYAVGIIFALGGALLGVWRWYARSRAGWIDEGESRRRAAEASEENAKATSANTTAVLELTKKLDSFSQEVQTELNGHKRRLGRIEDHLKIK